MREIEIRIRGLSRERVRDKGRSRRVVPGSGLIVLALVIVVASVYRNNPSTDRDLHIAVVNGMPVTAQRVLVLIDVSGSMPNDGGALVQAQLKHLTDAGIHIDQQANIRGFAISFTAWYSLLPAFNLQIAAHPHVDTVYIISDFSMGDSDDNQPLAVESFLKTVHDRHLRIYWATVRERPIQKYYEIALQSGGNVIPVQ